MKEFPLARPYIGQAEINSVVKVLKSGVLSLGPVGQEFEEAFAKRVGTRYACAVSSGTAGLHLAILAAGIGYGDEVITTPFSFVASANCILYVGAKPVFVDIDPITYNIDPAKIEKKITRRTKAILVVHIFGQPTAMDTVMKLAKKYKLRVIEDACESIGATYQGRQAGTFGESAVFAFYANKQMTTAEGGMIVTNSKRVYEQCKSLANQGRSANLQWLDHNRLGYNYRLDELSSALGREQLRRLDWMIAKRRQIAGWYTECLSEFADIVEAPQTAPGNTHTWFVYVVLIHGTSSQRDRVIQALHNSGVASKPYLPSIHLFKFYKEQFGYRRGDFPLSESVSDRSLALPFYIGLTKKDVKEIVSRFITTLTRYGNK
ncbi:MAG: DegT/DnrJ/EryC1/StrS family aminotransferase [Candidatus Magasanikbacteria bacterium]|nr:DegT/DnrJ/EryC1/StrS family aminotransferase [Candidatus Magasanikbacteria bacterium]